jgi:putative DNA primase/helicase
VVAPPYLDESHLMHSKELQIAIRAWMEVLKCNPSRPITGNRMDSANIEHTHGFYRRLLIIPFNQTIAENKQDRDLHTKILANKAGVLNWVVEGAREVIKNRDIFISEECRNFKARFLRETDSVAMFEDHIKEELQGDIYFETVADSYREYKAFCLEAGHKPLGRNNFTKRMEALEFEKNKKNDGWKLEKNYKSEKV